MIAYHFPPLAGSSGIQRTLRFVQHLPAFGWQPLVLTANVRAYERTSDDLLADVPAGTITRRAFALDTARQLSLRGRYIGWMARPDRWASWKFDAVRQGLRMIREFKPEALWSTYPIATAHVIGAELQRRSGLPWIADFRDPMAQDGYPADPVTYRRFIDIEKNTFDRAACTTFTTPGAAADYARRYPGSQARIEVLENGYDEEAFAGAQVAIGPLNTGAVTLLHSGIVYPSERDPAQLMVALRRLHVTGVLVPGRFKLRFRAAVAEALLHELAAAHDVQTYVEVLPALPYREALAEMLRADALLVMQASNCNAQIPAKLYEYLRAARPILCLADPVGDTAGALRAAGVHAIAPLDQAADIARLLAQFIAQSPELPSTQAVPTRVQMASRRGRAQSLAALLEAAATGGSS